MIPLTPPDSAPAVLGPVEAATLHTVLYFDIFSHPLTTDEIHRNTHSQKCSLTETAAALEDLQQLGILEEEEGCWFLSGKNSLVALRREREERAMSFMKKAKSYSAFISGFPFVRAVCISGSLSKGTMDKDSDIDYFVVTEPRRLWIARTVLVLYKKIFLLNSKKYFCVNYFVDSNELTIPDRNLFVATEIAFIRPMHEAAVYEKFMQENRWIELFFPNRNRVDTSALPPVRNGWFKRLAEKALGGKFGEWLDDRLLKMTLRRWIKRFAHLGEVRFNVDFRSRRHVSKHHPNGFQHRIAAELEKRRNELTERTGIQMPTMRWEWMTEHDTMKIV